MANITSAAKAGRKRKAAKDRIGQSPYKPAIRQRMDVAPKTKATPRPIGDQSVRDEADKDSHCIPLAYLNRLC